MKTKVAYRLFFIPISLLLILAACGEKKPSVTGTVTQWADDTQVANRQLALCKAVSESTTPWMDCVLETSISSTDSDGHFEFYDLEPGVYYIFYESGLGDFDEAMDYWGGRTFSWLDDDWNDEYWNEFVGFSGGWVELHVPEGMPEELITNSEFRNAYLQYFLLYPPSPFFVAFDVEKSFDMQGFFESHIIVEVVEGETTDINIYAIE